MRHGITSSKFAAVRALPPDNPVRQLCNLCMANNIPVHKVIWKLGVSKGTWYNWVNSKTRPLPVYMERLEEITLSIAERGAQAFERSGDR